MLWAMQKATNSIVEALNYNIYYLGAPTISNEYMQWYHPFKCITWFLYYHEANYLFTNAIMWVGFGLFLIFIIALLLKPKALLTSHGSARWAEYKDLLKMNLISSNGVTIGLYDSPFKRSLTKQLRRLEVKKNEKLAYAEMEFDEKQDKVLDRIPEKITVWLEEYNANTDPKRRKVLGQKIKQAQAYLKNPPKFDIKKYLRKPVLVFENTELSKLQEIFRKEKQNMVVVIDEYGGTLGIATLEDLNEEIFGNIADEYDTDDAAAEEPNLDNINDESTQNISQTILGSMRLSDLNENLGTSFSSEYYDTIGGLIMEKCGEVPQIGSTIKIENYNFTVIKTEGNRISELQVNIAGDEE